MMKNRSIKWGVTLTALMLSLSAGCGVSDLSAEFRSAAGDDLQTGVTALLNGLLEGAFAVLEPGDSTDSNGTSTAG